MKLSSIAAIRILAFSMMAAGEVWGIVHFWSDAKFAQFFVGSIALWITATFFFWKDQLAKRQVGFAEIAWISIAIFFALASRSDLGLSTFLLSIALAFVSVFELFRKLTAAAEKHEPSSARQIGLKYAFAAILWIWALRWLEKLLPIPMPHWIRTVALVPALLFVIRTLLPDSWFQKNNSPLHRDGDPA